MADDIFRPEDAVIALERAAWSRSRSKTVAAREALQQHINGLEQKIRIALKMFHKAVGDTLPRELLSGPLSVEAEAHWREMAADTEHQFWFTNREAAVLFAEIDRLRGMK